jgi:hypothetical protein
MAASRFSIKAWSRPSRLTMSGSFAETAQLIAAAAHSPNHLCPSGNALSSSLFLEAARPQPSEK